MSYDCTITPPSTGTVSTAICVETDAGREANFPGVTTETLEFGGYITYPVIGSASPTEVAAKSTSTSGSGNSEDTTVVSKESNALITSVPVQVADDADLSSNGCGGVPAQTTSASKGGAVLTRVGSRELAVALLVTGFIATIF